MQGPVLQHQPTPVPVGRCMPAAAQDPALLNALARLTSKDCTGWRATGTEPGQG